MFFYQMYGNDEYKFCYASEDMSFEGYRNTVCENCGRNITSFVYENDCHDLIIEGGKNYPDHLDFSGAGKRLVIFSKKAIDVFIENGLSGINIDQRVNIYNSLDTQHPLISDNVPVYYKVNVTGKIDYDYSAMFLKKKRKCPVCNQYDLNRQRLYPVYMDPNTWDGSDFCSLTTFPARVICTDRVIEIIKNNKLTGFEFEVIK